MTVPDQGSSRRLCLGRVGGDKTPLVISGGVAGYLLSLAQQAMPPYLDALAPLVPNLLPVLRDSPLASLQGFALEDLMTLVFRGWLMDLAVGAAVLDVGLVEPESGGLELHLGPETAHLSPLAFGLNVTRLPDEELLAGHLWLGWPPGPALIPPRSVLAALAALLSHEAIRDGSLTRSPTAETYLVLRHVGLLAAADSGRPRLAVPLVASRYAAAGPLVESLAEAGRRVADFALAPVLTRLPPGPGRLALLRLILETASRRVTEAGLLPAPKAGEIRRWLWWGPLFPGTERWDRHGS